VDPRQQAYQQGLYAAQKSRIAAGLLAILLGTLGIHNFYLGRTGIAVLQLLLSVLSLGFLAGGVALWALIEGILILCGSASFSTDAKGIPLRG
jgi:TM2 domain-containing membrane protein YozV